MKRVSPLASVRLSLSLAWQGLRSWTRRQVLVAAVASAGFAALVGVATVLIPNPLFARDIAPVAWNYPVWLLASVLTGMLIATYVRPSLGGEDAQGAEKRGSRMGMAGGVLTWFAVGCPMCNKIALLALGYSGAITWFTPIQPFLALGAIILSGGALISRLRGQVACSVPNREPAGAAL